MTDSTASADLSGTLTREVVSRPWRSTLAGALVSLLGTTVAVWVADLVLPGFVVEYPGGALAFAIVATVISVLAQPLMVGGSVRLGWWGVLLVALVGQAAVVGVAAGLMPRVEVDGFWPAFAVGWIVGGVATHSWVVDDIGSSRRVRKSSGPRCATAPDRRHRPGA